jgi:formylglycine-generating enzyme required for sulfatase activity
MAKRTPLKTALQILFVVLGVGATGGAIYWTARFASRHRSDPARCSGELVDQGVRCCARGQRREGLHCVGQPLSCPVGMTTAREGTGCVATTARVDFRGGNLVLNPEDWQAEGLVQPHAEKLKPFALDIAEVTFERWSHCAHAGSCPTAEGREPGLPVTKVDPKEAERFCRFAGGRLPTSAEWLLAALGPDGRRFPWGPTGLVCRRAAFGLVHGPCATGGGPEIAGSRPDGASPEGVVDLCGNVAEWTLEPDGRFVARGGSYRSESASELTSWASETPAKSAAWVGFRCAYDPAPAPGAR